MEAFTSIADKLNTFVKSGQDFITGNRHSKSRHNPIEILKRLQRESFSDLMKLRDRQDKVERMLIHKTSKGSPFEEGGTRVRGEVDAMAAVFLTDDLEQQNVDASRRAGLRTGIDARITFETKLRETDKLEAEFISGQRNHQDSDDAIGGALSLAKVSYAISMTDWLSMIAIPHGARCRDVTILTDTSLQEKCLTEYSSSGPPLLNQTCGSAIGVTVKKSNVVASLAQFVVDLPGSVGHCFSTFGQIVYQLPYASKLSLFGLHQMQKPSQRSSLGALTIPLGIWRRHEPRETSTQPFSSLGFTSDKNNPAGTLALMLESELDESTRIRGWLQMRNCNPSHLQWSVGMSDFPEEEIGWGLSLGGAIQGPKKWDHFQVEAFLKFNVGRSLSLQPAFVYLMDGNNQTPALMFRSTWSL